MAYRVILFSYSKNIHIKYVLACPKLYEKYKKYTVTQQLIYIRDAKILW